MNIEQLDALMAQSIKRFNELKVEEGVTQNRLAQIDTGLKQLQGEHEAYKTLRSMLELSATEQKNKTTVADDPVSLLPDPFKKKPKPENVANAA